MLVCLFFPTLGLVHHGNVATVTKQRAFNKSMITPFTEVIFIDEATETTLDIDDWKTLTQGGYAAHDVKYQSAKPFINRCPMIITSQRRLNFGPADQPAIDRRLTTYEFTSLPHPDKNAAAWLKQYPMDCLLWAAQMAERSSRFHSDHVEDQSDEDIEDGVLKEEEKEELRKLCLDEVLSESNAPAVEEDSQIEIDASQDGSESSQDQTIGALRRAMEECSQGSLRHRQVSRLLQVQLEQRESVREAEESNYQQRQENLMSKGVTREHVDLLPRDPSEVLPTPINNDLDDFRREALREEINKKRERAKEAFQTPWLQETETELQDCTRKLNHSALSQETRASTEAYRELLQDKLKNFHNNLGTIGCEFALEQRKRWCVSQGLLRKEERDRVANLFQSLPTGEETEDDEEEALFITQSTPATPRVHSHPSSQRTTSKKRRSKKQTNTSQVPKKGRITDFYTRSQQ